MAPLGHPRAMYFIAALATTCHQWLQFLFFQSWQYDIIHVANTEHEFVQTLVAMPSLLAKQCSELYFMVAYFVHCNGLLLTCISCRLYMLQAASLHPTDRLNMELFWQGEGKVAQAARSKYDPFQAGWQSSSTDAPSSPGRLSTGCQAYTSLSFQSWFCCHSSAVFLALHPLGAASGHHLPLRTHFARNC